MRQAEITGDSLRLPRPGRGSGASLRFRRGHDTGLRSLEVSFEVVEAEGWLRSS
jgi:hypothetical protein